MVSVFMNLLSMVSDAKSFSRIRLYAVFSVHGCCMISCFPVLSLSNLKPAMALKSLSVKRILDESSFFRGCSVVRMKVESRSCLPPSRLLLNLKRLSSPFLLDAAAFGTFYVGRAK